MDIQLQQNVDGPYVEFNLTGTDTTFAAGSAESYFLDNYVFAIFAASFAAARPQFDRHGPTRFAGADLVRLRDALNAQQTRLAQIDDADSFSHTIEEWDGHHFLQMLLHEERDYQFEWPALWVKLLGVNGGLLALVDKCVQEARVLWVLGL